ncbi:MAG: MarR family transcriptional regulator [Actinobacteria bacterium]|nr:MarR family transcriptional regulator [Actinomycetota bacterium]
MSSQQQSQTKPGGKTTSGEPGVARAISEVLWRLVISDKPRVPMVAAEFQISPPQMHVLRLLHDNDSMTMSEIAESLFCDASNVTAIIDHLEERGLAERGPDPSDRRVRRIAVTAEGRKLQRRLLDRLFEPLPGVTELTATEQRELLDLLAKAVDLRDESD